MIAAPGDDVVATYATPPALLDAADDPALDGATVKVLLWCHANLPPNELQRVKAGGVAASLRYHRHTVGRALNTLVERGYLEAGPRDGPTPTYRLCHERAA